MWLFALFVAVPILEIALFIQIGGLIGLGWTLLIVIATALTGTYLVRSQGATAMGEVRRSFDSLRDPTEPLAHGAMILVAGMLLLTPGFFTDAVGFSLLLPPIRRRVFQYLSKRIAVQMHSSTGQPGPRPGPGPHPGPQTGPQPGPRVAPGRPPHRPMRDDVIEGEYTEIDETADRPRKPSGWTRH